MYTKRTIKINEGNFGNTIEHLTKLKPSDKLFVRWKVIQNEHSEKALKKSKN